MQPWHITFLDQGTIPPHIEWPEPSFPHIWQAHHNTAPDLVVERLKHTDIVITNKVVLDRTLLTQCPNLKYVQVSATGMNNVDVEACHELGIGVGNVQGYARHAVPEWVVGQLFSLVQSHAAYRRIQEARGWLDSEFFALRTAPVREVRTMTIGILGRGAIGQGVADRLAAMGSKVLFLERPTAGLVRQGYHDITAVLLTLDALVLCCPLTDDNVGMVNADFLYRMKPGAYLLNPSRGGLVQEADLVQAITTGHLGGVALDVVSAEPLRADNPLCALMEEPNVIITPHIAWSSDEAITELMAQVITRMNAFVTTCQR